MSTPEPSPASKPPRPPVFGNSAAVFAFLLLAVGLGVAAHLITGSQRVAANPQTQSAYAIGDLVGTVFGAIMFPLLLGWIAYWLGFRSTKAARITACTVALLICLGSVGRMMTSRNKARLANQSALTQELDAARKEQAQAIRSGDTGKIADASDRSLAAIERMGDDSPELKTVATTRWAGS